MQTPVPKKKAISDTPYTYGALICPLSEEVCSIIKYYAKKYIPKDVLFVDEDKGIGSESEPHITAKYGFLDGVDSVRDVCEGFGSFPISFGKVCKFDNNPMFDVIYVEVDSEPLVNLNALLKKHCNTEETFAQFTPHATIAFVQKGSCDDLVDDAFFDKLNDNIESTLFSNKDGSVVPINL